ncbi:MAG TPA: carboxylesterase family protein, partial [Stellaceae bacterium]
NFASASTAFAAPVTDFVYACPAYQSNISLSAFKPVSAYQFQDENAPEAFLPPASFPYAAAHASELQYLFTLPVRVPRPALDGPQRHLSRDMQQYWTNFVKSGTPNGPGVPNWAQFNAVEGNFQALMPSQPQPTSNFGALHHCDFWATL